MRVTTQGETLRSLHLPIVNRLWRVRALLFVITTLVLALLTPVWNDWVRFYQPAALNLLHGQSPYTITGIFHPPWLFVLMIPLALLPWQIGAALVGALTLFAYAYTAERAGARLLVLVLFLTSPQVLWAIYLTSMDWVVLLGLFLPPWLGLFFVLVKPQIGIGAAALWAFQAWKTGGLRRLFWTFAPVSAAVVVAIAIFGLWFRDTSFVVTGDWNTSFFPYSIPVGLVLIVSAIRRSDRFRALIASPFFSPYIPSHSWGLLTLGVAGQQAEAIACIAGMWLAWLLGHNSFPFIYR